MNTIRVSNSLDPDQPDVLSGLICVKTVCKDHQQTIKFAQKSILFDSVGLQASPSYCCAVKLSVVACACSYVCFEILKTH